MRIKIGRIIINIIFLSLLLSLFYAQIIKGHFYRRLSKSNCVRLIPQEGSRGRILDRQGNVIVDNYLSYDVVILSENLKEREKTLRRLAEIVNLSYEELKKRLKKGYRASFLPITLVKDVSRPKAIIIEELKADLPGVSVQVNPQRYYPHQKMAAHVVGYLSEIDRWRLTRLKDYGYKTRDIVGYSGVEEKYDYYLRAEEGGLQVEVDHQGRFHKVLGFKQPGNGKDIGLTIDIRLQKIAEDNLAGQKGAIVIMSPDSGEILAMASFPDFAPEAFLKKGEHNLADILVNPNAPLLNRAISSAHPPGSVFKVVTAATGLESKKINTQTSFDCLGATLVGRRRFSCWDTHGVQDLLAAITHSCDVFFYRTGILAGAERISDLAAKFGLGSQTQIDLPSETSGLLPSPAWKRIRRHLGWFDGDTANFSIGQGDLLTSPIQITRMMAVFANNGILVSPFIVKSIDGKDISGWRKKPVELPIKKKTISVINSGLKAVIEGQGGTAHNLYIPSVSIAGKTGTAQAPPGQPHAWFAGFFPFEHPKYVICTFLEHAGSSHVATDITKKIIEEMKIQGLI